MELKNLIKESKNVWSVGEYTNQGRLVRLKKDKDKIIPIGISRYPIEYVKLINNGVSTNQMAIKFEGINEILAPIDVIDTLCIREGLLVKGKNEARNFISAMTAAIDVPMETRIDGGYVSLEEISAPHISDTDLHFIQKYIVDYIAEYFTPEMITAFKLMLLMPFHWIMKNDVDIIKKELVKGLSLYGIPDTAKTLVVLYTTNLFVNEPLSLDSEAEVFDSVAGFRGKLCRNLGITLIDEFNKLLSNKELKQSLNDIINAIPTLKLTIQGVSGGGAITNDKYTATPVFTSNVKAEWNESNRKRLDVIHMKKTFNPDIKISIRKGKRLMLLFGELIAWTFKNNYSEIVSCRDSLQASEYLLSKIEGLNLDGIINCPDTRVTDLSNIPLSILVKKDLDKRSGKENTQYSEIKYGELNLPWYIKSTDTYLAVDGDRFYEYLRDLIGDQSIDITKYLNNELSIDTGTFRINGAAKKFQRIKIWDFEKWLGLYETSSNLEEPLVTEKSWELFNPKFRLGEY